MRLHFGTLLLSAVIERRARARDAAHREAAELVASSSELRQEQIEAGLTYAEATPRLGLAGQGITDARIHAMRGQTGQALAALRKAVDAGWRSRWRMDLLHNPELAALHSEPGFQALVTDLEADMLAQRQLIRDLEARGELPPPLE